MAAKRPVWQWLGHAIKRRVAGGEELIKGQVKSTERRETARRVAGAVILIAAAGALALNWPGHLSYDSVLQLAEGRTESYSGAHPPVMSWLLGLADALVPGAAAFIVFQTVLIFGALLALLSLGRRPGWVAVVTCLILATTPQLLIYPAIVWKDVLFAGATVSGFACLAWAAQAWRHHAARWLCLAAAAGLLTLAALARQNGAVVLPAAALALGLIAGRGGGARRGLAYGAGFLALTAAIAGAGALMLAARIDPEAAPNSPWRALQAYDIVNTLSFAPSLPLPILRRQAPRLEQVLRTQGVAAYSPVRADDLEPILDRAKSQGPVEAPLAGQWRQYILAHPLLYLRARARTFDWVFLTPDPDQCVLIYTGVDGDPSDMAYAGLTPRKSERDDALSDAAMALAPSPLYSHATYAGLSLALLVFLLWRRRAPDLAVAGLLVATLLFAASFFVISIACDYRYLYALDIAAIAALIYAAATLRTSAPRS